MRGDYMPVTISDEQLNDLKMNEHEARVEIACRLFDAQKLTFHSAMRMAEMDRMQFEAALVARGIAIYRPNAEELKEEVEALRKLGA